MDFVINNKIEIFTMDNKRVGISLIQDYDDNDFYISVPMDKGILRSLGIGQEFRFIYYEENRLFSFKSMVGELLKENIMLYKVRQAQDFEVVQRREDFRLPIVHEMKYMKFRPDMSKELETMDVDIIERKFEKQLVECLSVDLSGRGIGLVMDEAVDAGEILILLLRHKSLDLVLKGEVIHKVKLFKKNGLKHRVGVGFIDLDFKKKEAIVKYIFQKMREQLKNRKE